MHPVSQFAVVDEMLVRVAEQGIFSDFGETQLVEMLVDVPFPNDIPVSFSRPIALICNPLTHENILINESIYPMAEHFPHFLYG